MPDIRSALLKILTPGHYGVSGRNAITVREEENRPLVQVAGWAGFEKAVLPVLAPLGLQSAGDYRHVQRQGDISCYRIAPDRLLLRGIGLTAVMQASEEAGIMALDLGHARTVVRLDGEATADLLARLTSVDVRDVSFPVGAFAQCGIHHVGVLLERLDRQSFRLMIPYTWSASLVSYLMDTALPFGISVEEGMD